MTAQIGRIDALLDRAAALFPQRPAVEFDGATCNYAELAARVRATSAELRALGVHAGDRVLLVGANGPHDVMFLFALAALGAWPVLASARVAPVQLDGIIAHSEPRFGVFVAADEDAQRHGARLGAVEGAFEALGPIAFASLARGAQPEPPAERPEDDVAAVIYTSGTTAAPKAAMLSNANLVYIGLTQRRLRRYTETDKAYCPLPLAHIGALGILMCAVAAGACLHLARRFVPAELAAAIREGGITVVPGLPPLHLKFLAWVNEHRAQFERGRVRLVTTSSSPLYLPVKRAVEALYGCSLQNAYGLTEATGVVFQVPCDERRDDTSVGPAIPGVSVRISAESGADAAQGERGEILVRGPNVFLGYYRNAAATRATFTADAWLRTGDVGYVDESGVAFIAGRLKETIKRSGYNIYPAAIEAALHEHPAVAQSAVVGGVRGVDEEVVAFVEAKRDVELTHAALLAFLAERVAAYELPGIVEFMERLPTLPNGKIDRFALRQRMLEVAGG